MNMSRQALQTHLQLRLYTMATLENTHTHTIHMLETLYSDVFAKTIVLIIYKETDRFICTLLKMLEVTRQHNLPKRTRTAKHSINGSMTTMKGTL